MPTDTRATTFVVPAQAEPAPAKAGTSTPSASNPLHSPTTQMRVQGVPCLAALPCLGFVSSPPFRPLSLSATPRESFRAPPPRGLSPICHRRLKPATAKRLPSWPPSPRVTQSMQFQAAPISPRIDSPSCAAISQARDSRKKRAKTIRIDSNPPVQREPKRAPRPALTCGLGYRHAEWHNCRAVTDPTRGVSRRRHDELLQGSVYLD